MAPIYIQRFLYVLLFANQTSFRFVAISVGFFSVAGTSSRPSVGSFSNRWLCDVSVNSDNLSEADARIDKLGLLIFFIKFYIFVSEFFLFDV